MCEGRVEQPQRVGQTRAFVTACRDDVRRARPPHYRRPACEKQTPLWIRGSTHTFKGNNKKLKSHTHTHARVWFCSQQGRPWAETRDHGRSSRRRPSESAFISQVTSTTPVIIPPKAGSRSRRENSSNVAAAAKAKHAIKRQETRRCALIIWKITGTFSLHFLSFSGFEHCSLIFNVNFSSVKFFRGKALFRMNRRPLVSSRGLMWRQRACVCAADDWLLGLEHC